MNDVLLLKIEPFDVLLFRDGRPFNFTDFASSIPYPYPTTFSGALRKLFGDLLGISTQEWNAVLGDASKSSLLFSGPFLARDDELYVSVPKIFLVEKKKTFEDGSKKQNISKVAGVLEIFSKVVSETDSGIIKMENSSANTEEIFWHKKSEAMEPASGFIKADDLIEAIEGKKKPEEIEIFSERVFFSDDIRTHIRLKGRTVAEKGGKFSVRYLSLKEGAFFVVGVEKSGFEEWQKLEDSMKKSHVMRLGGEARQVKVDSISKDSKIFSTFSKLRDLEKTDDPERIFITPLAFAGKDQFDPKIAITSRARILRGWDYRKMSKFFGVYDAGSVFIFHNFKSIRENEDFSNFRSLGYNMNVKGGVLL
ncbi:MAG: hypothetical protein DRP30_03875 [Thermotoga sp.]|nr:MAG: hypothetical protein DRP30_03875 [Thermotoga sp.]